MNDSVQDLYPPGADEIEALARAVLRALPEAFRGPAAEVALIVEDLADDATLDAMGIDDPFGLTGLYDGLPLPEKLVSAPWPRPDTITLYRRAILDEWIERGDIALADLVANVVVHELAHHFGWSDDDIARIDPWWE
jgi:predicted Zn-dependent protease with MMP-like domain